MPDLTLRADPGEAAENVASVERVPGDILPPGPAHDALLWVATEKTETCCYASGGKTYGVWCAWLGDLADRRTDKNGRVPLAEEWVPNCCALLAEIGVIPDEEARR
ncbi:MAG TPA: hypothetical protein VGS80_15690 [Ktedonobacterales bacterium]|nr:hypothetical protein [Ktedonobacterales bacterium]